jgi:preprotein translocase subunit SecY
MEGWIYKIVKYIPTVKKPTYRQSLNTRLKWTGIVLITYLLLSYITVYGVEPSTYEQFRYIELILGSRFGSLMTLGIGPIVTAGIILQLLVGSKIINWDMTKEEDRKKFQAWNKFLSVIFCFVTAAVYVFGGAILVLGPISKKIIVLLQLAVGGLIVILLDDVVSKWGIGSGISLFIAAGVATQILIRIFSPLPATCKPFHFSECTPSLGNLPIGLFWQFLLNALVGNTALMIQTLLPILSTVLVFLIVVYIQDIAIEIPLTFSALRGFGRTWPLKLLYTSNIPVILAGALIANFQLLGRIGLTQHNGLHCGLLGCYDANGNPVSGAVYYLSTPSNFLLQLVSSGVSSADLARVAIHIALFAILCTIFSVFWVSTSGMDAKSVAEQIESVGLQIPGYRRDAKTMEAVLNKYIPQVAFLGGLFVGLLAAFADITAAIGSGTGILLTVMIIYQYYEQLSMENLEEAHPIVRKIIGE